MVLFIGGQNSYDCCIDIDNQRNTHQMPLLNRYRTDMDLPKFELKATGKNYVILFSSRSGC
jgi:hypothetical protein